MTRYASAGARCCGDWQGAADVSAIAERSFELELATLVVDARSPTAMLPLLLCGDGDERQAALYVRLTPASSSSSSTTDDAADLVGVVAIAPLRLDCRATTLLRLELCRDALVAAMSSSSSSSASSSSSSSSSSAVQQQRRRRTAVRVTSGPVDISALGLAIRLASSLSMCARSRCQMQRRRQSDHVAAARGCVWLLRRC